MVEHLKVMAALSVEPAYASLSVEHLKVLSSPLDGGLNSRAPKGPLDGGLNSRACLRILMVEPLPVLSSPFWSST